MEGFKSNLEVMKEMMKHYNVDATAMINLVSQWLMLSRKERESITHDGTVEYDDSELEFAIPLKK